MIGRNLLSVDIPASSYAFYIPYTLMLNESQIAPSCLSVPNMKPSSTKLRIPLNVKWLLWGSMCCIKYRIITDVCVSTRGL